MTTKRDIPPRLRNLADTMQALARDMAAVGMGRGEWPEHSLELHNAGKMAIQWAHEIEVEIEADNP